MKDKRPSYKYHYVKQTDWNTCQSELSAKVGVLIGCLNTPADIVRVLNKVDSAIISPFQKACPERKCSGMKKLL